MFFWFYFWCVRVVMCAGLPGTLKYGKNLPKGKTETAAEKPSSDKSEIGRGRDRKENWSQACLGRVVVTQLEP